jgi:hypothetical protein
MKFSKTLCSRPAGTRIATSEERHEKSLDGADLAFETMQTMLVAASHA